MCVCGLMGNSRRQQQQQRQLAMSLPTAIVRVAKIRFSIPFVRFCVECAERANRRKCYAMAAAATFKFAHGMSVCLYMYVCAAACGS